ncbi:MAG: hypothetical protein WB793_04760 [Candidatus Dormiibacterota bacterium]
MPVAAGDRKRARQTGTRRGEWFFDERVIPVFDGPFEISRVLTRRGCDDRDINRSGVAIRRDVSTDLMRERTRAMFVGVIEDDLEVERRKVSGVPGADRSAAENQGPQCAAIMAAVST